MATLKLALSDESTALSSLESNRGNAFMARRHTAFEAQSNIRENTGDRYAESNLRNIRDEFR